MRQKFVHVFRVGPLFDEPTSLYVPFSSEKEELEIVSADDDSDGLRQIADMCAAYDVLYCEPQLSAAGGRAGFQSRELSDDLQVMQALLALQIAVDPDFDNIFNFSIADVFFRAASAFWHGSSRHWWPADKLLDLELELLGVPESIWVGVVRQTPNPSVLLFIDPDHAGEYISLDSAQKAAFLRTCDHLRVTFETEPQFAVTILEERYDLTAVPHPKTTVEGEAAIMDEVQAVIMASALAAIACIEELERPAHGTVQTGDAILRASAQLRK